MWESSMSVRKQHWVTRKGEPREAWIANYTDGEGTRRVKFFKTKKAADAYHAKVTVEVADGVHTPPAKSVTVKAAAEDWLRFVAGEKRERATLRGYRVLVERHIVPRLGATKLATLTQPRVQKLRDDLLDTANGGVVSRRLARKVLATLKAILKDAKRRGNVAQNVAADVMISTSSRDRPKPRVGVDIPTTDEIRRVIDAAREGYGRTFLMTAAFTGLRASELRGLRWEDLDLKHGVLRVHQRADRYNDIGRPKSAAGERSVPIGPMVANTLRQWKLACPKSAGDLVFPTRTGEVQALNNIVNRLWRPTQVRAGVVDADGKEKYTGLHSLRHFYASWCINRKKEGGLELPAKTVQARLGHASIVMTLDRYGHLFPSDDGAELAEAERAIFAT
jgi:integrase